MSNLYFINELIKDKMEIEWRQNMPRYKFYELLNIFPEAKPIIKKILIQEIKNAQTDLANALKLERQMSRIVFKAKYEDRWFWKLVMDVLYIEPLREGRERKIKKNRFQLSALKEPAKINLNKITDQDIERAKEVLIENFYNEQLRKFGKTATGVCPFHSERVGSFTIYLEQNRWYCFGCQNCGDVIDFIMKTRDCDFVKAVKFLNNK